ncbi:MAG: cytochrome c3 family protein [Desulfobacterales bacterium]
MDCNVYRDMFPQAPDSIDKLIAEGRIKKKEVMNRCVQCHRKLTDAGQKTGPVKCSECHPRSTG